jgi:hypothetical protein
MMEFKKAEFKNNVTGALWQEVIGKYCRTQGWEILGYDDSYFIFADDGGYAIVFPDGKCPTRKEYEDAMIDIFSHLDDIDPGSIRLDVIEVMRVADHRALIRHERGASPLGKYRKEL